MSRSAKEKTVKAMRNMPAAVILQKKSKCDAKALKIVEQLIEPDVDVDWMLQNLIHINREHMEDAAEERAISKLCGYVLCDNPLTKVTTKKYQISLSQKRVYNVEVVKNYCSFSCYQAMDYLLEQLYTDPLWVERPPKQFYTIPMKNIKLDDTPGVEVDVSLFDPSVYTKEELMLLKNKNKKSEDDMMDEGEVKSEKSSEPIDRIRKNLEGCKIEEKKKDETDKVIEEKVRKMKLIDDNEILKDSTNESKIPTLENINEPSESHDSSLRNEINQLMAEEVEEKSKPEEIVFKNKVKPKPTPKPVSVFTEPLLQRLEKYFSEWITEKTVTLLSGTAAEKKEIYDKVAYQEKHIVLCKKLATLQLDRDRDSDSEDLVEASRPLPMYEEIKEQTKKLELKVRSYYAGDMKVQMPVEEQKKEDSTLAIPITEANAPDTLRRGVFLDKLRIVIPDLLETLTESNRSQSIYMPDKLSSLKTLISTFSLSAENIVFKTAEWPLIGILIIKLMSLFDPDLKRLISTNHSDRRISMILTSYELGIQLEYLDCLIESKIPIKVKSDNSDRNIVYDDEETRHINLRFNDDDDEEEEYN